MVRIRGVAWVLAAVVALAVHRPALAEPIALTGNVASDFTTANGSTEVAVSQGNSFNTTGSAGSATQLPSGVFVQNIWLNYNPTTDTLSVGFQGYKSAAGQEIFGDYSGAPNPTPAQDLSAATNPQNLLSFALTFAPVTQNASGAQVPGKPLIIAGIPQDKTQVGSGTIDGYTVSKYSANGNGLQASFGVGQQIANPGNLAFNPSAAHPDLEFTINNFSKISGVNVANGLYLEGYSGTPGNTEGKFQDVTPVIQLEPQFPPIIPEPTTWMIWAALAGGAAIRIRRSRRMCP